MMIKKSIYAAVAHTERARELSPKCRPLRSTGAAAAPELASGGMVGSLSRSGRLGGRPTLCFSGNGTDGTKGTDGLWLALWRFQATGRRAGTGQTRFKPFLSDFNGVKSRVRMPVFVPGEVSGV
jgi:hypothetical protein